MNNQTTPLLRKLLNPRVWAYALFWSWNIIFLAFMALGFAPNVLPEMITGVRVAPPSRSAYKAFNSVLLF